MVLIAMAVLVAAFNAASVYSGENAYILFKQVKGFNGDVSTFAPYNHIYHPILSSPVKLLYERIPGLPWYPLFLFSSCIIACLSLLGNIRQKGWAQSSWIFCIVLFLVFIRVFFAHLEFSFVASLLAIAACTRLVYGEQRTKNSWRPDGWALFLLVLALAWRMHVVIPVIGIFLAYFITIGRNRIRIIASTLLLGFIAALVLYFSQEKIYTTRDAEWPQKEAYRSRVYQLYNGQPPSVDSNDFLQARWELLSSGLIIDRHYLSELQLEQLQVRQEHSDWKAAWPSRTAWRWTFTNNRIFFAAYLLVLLMLIAYKRKLFPHLLALLFFLAGYFFLLLTAKIPSYLLLTGFTCLTWVGLLDLPLKEQVSKDRKMRIFLGAFLLLSVWAVVRIWKDGEQNRKAMMEFQSFHSILGSHPDTLFIASENRYLQKMQAFISPSRYPLPNYLDSEFFLHDEARPVLRRFGLENVSQWPKAQNLLFVGRPPEALMPFFKEMYGLSIRFVPVQGLSDQYEVYQIRVE